MCPRLTCVSPETRADPQSLATLVVQYSNLFFGQTAVPLCPSDIVHGIEDRLMRLVGRVQLHQATSTWSHFDSTLQPDELARSVAMKALPSPPVPVPIPGPLPPSPVRTPRRLPILCPHLQAMATKAVVAEKPELRATKPSDRPGNTCDVATQTEGLSRRVSSASPTSARSSSASSSSSSAEAQPFSWVEAPAQTAVTDKEETERQASPTAVLPRHPHYPGTLTTPGPGFVFGPSGSCWPCHSGLPAMGWPWP